MRSRNGRIVVFACVILMGAAAFGQARPHIVFVTGDHEYGSEVSMPMLAAILEAHHGMRTTVLYAVNDKGERDPQYDFNIPGLEALADADLAVFFLRYRKLPEDQLDHILRYIDAGKPILGFRTTTHAFQYPDGPFTKWNDDFGRDVFGQKWISHHGHNNSSRVFRTLKDHPIMRGVADRFWCPSWLYVVAPLHGDCTVLMLGQAIRGTAPGDETYGTPQPVAWTKTYTGPSGKTAPVFFTTLGHPRDFLDESMRRLFVNAVYWALGRAGEVPEGGTKVDMVGEYNPPDPK